MKKVDDIEELMRRGCLDRSSAEMIYSNRKKEEFEIPPRSEPDKYIYIITDEEKKLNHPRLPMDECWAMRSFWRVPSGLWEQGSEFGSCFWRRFKE